MGNNKKKQIKIPIVIVILLIIILAGGICFAYFFTDIFKTDKEMFFTYIVQNSELLDFFEDSDLEEYKSKQEITAYSNEGTLTISYEDDSTLENTSITFSGSTDKYSNYKYQTASLNYSDADSITVHYINMEDYYGIKIDNILNKYVAVENNNLKEWVDELGILDDDEIELLPDKIDLDDYETTDLFTDEEIETLKDKYSSLLIENLSDESFYSSKIDSKTLYTLVITNTELAELSNTFLEEIKNDEIILNSIENDLLQISDCTEDEASELIEELIEYINEFQEDIQDTISESEETTIYINLYVEDKELVETEIILTDVLNISIENGDDSYSIVIESLEEDDDDSDDVSIDVDSLLTTETEDDTTEDEVSTDENVSETETVEETEDENETNEENEVEYGEEYEEDETTSESVDTNYIKIDLLKNKTDDNLQYSISCTAGETNLFDCIITYEGIETLSTVVESFSFSIEEAELSYAYENVKTFGTISEEDITVDDMLFLNTYSDTESISNIFTEIVERVEALDEIYVTNSGFTTTPGIYYLPATVPYAGMMMLSNDIKIGEIGVGALTLALGTTVYNQTSTTITSSDLSTTEIQTFNAKFTDYEGTGLNAANIRALYSIVKSSNASEELSSRNFIVTINGEIPESTPETLSSDTTYKVTLEYSEEGYVSNIIYVDENEEDVEESTGDETDDESDSEDTDSDSSEDEE